MTAPARLRDLRDSQRAARPAQRRADHHRHPGRAGGLGRGKSTSPPGARRGVGRGRIRGRRRGRGAGPAALQPRSSRPRTRTGVKCACSPGPGGGHQPSVRGRARRKRCRGAAVTSPPHRQDRDGLGRHSRGRGDKERILDRVVPGAHLGPARGTAAAASDPGRRPGPFHRHPDRRSALLPGAGRTARQRRHAAGASGSTPGGEHHMDLACNAESRRPARITPGTLSGTIRDSVPAARGRNPEISCSYRSVDRAAITADVKYCGRPAHGTPQAYQGKAPPLSIIQKLTP